MLKDKSDLYNPDNPYRLKEDELRVLNSLPEEAREEYIFYCKCRDKVYRAVAEARYRVRNHEKNPYRSDVFVLDGESRYIITGASPVIFENGGCWYAIVENPFRAVNKRLILTRISGPQGEIEVVLDNRIYAASPEGEKVARPRNYAGIPVEGAIFDRENSAGIDTSRFDGIQYASSTARVRIKYGSEGGDVVSVGEELVTLPPGEILIENMSDKPIKVLPN